LLGNSRFVLLPVFATEVQGCNAERSNNHDHYQDEYNYCLGEFILIIKNAIQIKLTQIAGVASLINEVKNFNIDYNL
jgi:hypothetical protein